MKDPWEGYPTKRTFIVVGATMVSGLIIAGLASKFAWGWPVEAVMLWFAAAWGPVVTYSVLRVKFHQKAVKLGLIKVDPPAAKSAYEDDSTSMS